MTEQVLQDIAQQTKGDLFSAQELFDKLYLQCQDEEPGKHFKENHWKNYDKNVFLELERQARALFRLLVVGIYSDDKIVHEKVAMFAFDRFPFMFAVSAVARFYLPFLLDFYDNAYVFVRCSVYADDPEFDFVGAKSSWWLTTIETHGFVYGPWSSLKENQKNAKELLGRLKKHKRCLVVKIFDERTGDASGEVRLPMRAFLSKETVAKLKLVKKPCYSAAFHWTFHELDLKEALKFPEYYQRYRKKPQAVFSIIPTV